MKWLIAVLLCCAAPVAAQETAPAAKPVQVPYRLTDTHHVLLRVKINGKGPYNFIVDTGCPVLIVAADVGKRLGLKNDDKGWATLERLEMEGGLVQTQVRARIETPLQIEGMNGLGLAGVELHGLIGYSVLARYRMEFDFKRGELLWTPLAYEPPQPRAAGGKVPGGGLDMMAGVVRVLSFLIGNQAPPPAQPRGFLGLQLAERDGSVLVERVLSGSPAAEADIKSGDRVEAVDGRALRSLAELHAAAGKLTAGSTLRLSLQRNGAQHTTTITAGAGL
jgi:serine protease DegQ